MQAASTNSSLRYASPRIPNGSDTSLLKALYRCWLLVPSYKLIGVLNHWLLKVQSKKHRNSAGFLYVTARTVCQELASVTFKKFCRNCIWQRELSDEEPWPGRFQTFGRYSVSPGWHDNWDIVCYFRANNNCTTSQDVDWMIHESLVYTAVSSGFPGANNQGSITGYCTVYSSRFAWTALGRTS
jgi:hypothetical protein